MKKGKNEKTRRKNQEADKMELSPSIHNCTKCECSDGDVSLDVIRVDIRKKLPGGQHIKQHSGWLKAQSNTHHATPTVGLILRVPINTGHVVV